MWHLITWFSVGFGSVRLRVGLKELKNLFEPKLFDDSLLQCYEDISEKN